MAATENTYRLKIVRAIDLPSIADPNEAPSAYVEISVNDFRRCSRAIEHSSNPSWDEMVELTAVDPATFLSLKVFQHTSMLPHQFLGGVTIQIKTLLEVHGQDVTLKLQPPQLETEFSRQEVGSIVIHFQEDMSMDMAPLLEFVNLIMDDLILWVADKEMTGEYAAKLQSLFRTGPSVLCDFGDVCKEQGDAQNICNSIVLYKAAVKLTSADHEDRAVYLNRLSGALAERFSLQGDVGDIKEAVLYGKEVIQITMQNDLHPPEYLANLGTYLQRGFQHLGDIADLNMAIQHQEKAVNATPQGDPNLSMYLSNLGNSFQTRFQHLGDISDLNIAIQHHKKAVNTTPEGHPSLPGYLNNLGLSLRTHYLHLGDIADLNMAIQHQEKAVNSAPQGHPNLANYLSNLGNSFSKRFEHLGDIADLNMAIQHQEKAMNTTPQDHPSFPAHLGNLGLSFQRRFQHLGDIADLNMAIQHHKKAVNTTPQGHTSLPGHLNNLGNSFQIHFLHLGDIADLNMAIQHQEKAVNSAPQGHPNLANYLSNLGNSFSKRFEHLGDIADLNMAIQHHKKAVNTTQQGHPSLPGRLNNLGVSFTTHFEQLGDISDLNMAIQHQERAVNTTPQGHPNLSMYLNSLGNSFSRHFQHLGDISDLNIAIQHYKKAVNTTPQGHPSLPLRIINLGVSFTRRFELLGDISDLNMAIQHQEKAVDTTPQGHPNLSMCLNSLGHSFSKRFQHLGDISDLNMAIQHQERAVNATSEGHPSLPGRLINLGNSFHTCFVHLGDISDLNMAIQHQEKAVNTTPQGHPDLSMCLNSLGHSFATHFKHVGDIEDLNMAIQHQERAVNATPEDHPSLPKRLINLGNSFHTRFQHLDDIADFTLAASAFAKGAQIFGPPLHCFTAAIHWIQCAHSNHHDTSSQLLQSYICALQLLPKLAWLGRNVESRYHGLLNAGSLACDAAAIALQSQNTEQSVKFLEQGRSVVWGQFLQLRTPLDDLRKRHPILCSQLSQFSSMLQCGEFSNVEDHHDAAQQWEKLITEIRNIPDFHQFLLPKEYAELSKVSQHGFVIIVNVSTFRSDALVIKAPMAPPYHVHLNKFSYNQAEKLQARLYNNLIKGGFRNQRTPDLVQWDRKEIMEEDECFRSILAELWLNVVEPILSELSLMHPQEENLPRLWWCLTGPLAFLPLHAAGIYPANGDDKVICLADFAISSYTSTLSALAESQRPFQNAQEGIRFLAVIQPDIPQQDSLPGTMEELAFIKCHTANHQMLTTLVGTEVTLDKVVSAMGECSWIHLACHGVQDLNAPTKSGFELEPDGGRLELSKIISKSVPCADFAFLSACQTAAGDLDHPDEAIHLAAGMMSAGYHSVIATMWAISDNDGPSIADAVYSHLLADKEPSSQKAAEALHLAVQALRKRCNSESFASWVPFIHMGI